MYTMTIGKLLTCCKRAVHRKGFGIQSPWAYELVCDVFFEKLPYYCFTELKALEKTQKECGESLSRKDNEQLFRIANYFKPKRIVQTGTGNGVSLCYLSAPHPLTPCTGICGERVAEDGFAQPPVAGRMEFRRGDELSVLQECFKKGATPDLLHIAFTDRAEEIYEWAAERYDSLSREKGIVPVIIVEKIARRRRALWTRILADERAVITFDLGNRGIVVFDPKRIKQNYML